MSTTLFNIAWVIVVAGALILLVIRSRDRRTRDRAADEHRSPDPALRTPGPAAEPPTDASSPGSELPERAPDIGSGPPR